MYQRPDRREARLRRHVRLRAKVSGTSERPRLSVFRSLHHIYAQIIDDTKGLTLVAASTVDPELRKQCNGNGGNIEAAKAVGAAIAQKALEKGIQKVVFDRGGQIYHGRVKALASSAREGGLEF
ncbi:LSU ribosomal protein L18P [Hydrogenispora ethanolica]|jgi:large subunit ribosomal protein L18|uniref:Large ribosomal subunit protein uL18 n=1 Tax=Hydrogenispora ethanolica TaxID=1082276 RepID=A0A4R1RJY5_HYDET|nr:50S ribosomal protein L18 [Hydrogenispora ethanolica]TCL66475.1 LSU ribosomal protein L18P [Hydrogenispora ethanolica]